MIRCFTIDDFFKSLGDDLWASIHDFFIVVLDGIEVEFEHVGLVEQARDSKLSEILKQAFTAKWVSLGV